MARTRSKSILRKVWRKDPKDDSKLESAGLSPDRGVCDKREHLD